MIRALGIVTILTAMMIIFACGTDRVYEENIDFQNRVWPVDSVAAFSFRINDTTVDYNLYFNIRNTADYPFHNIYVQYNLQDSTGNVLREELVNKSLFAEKSGEPLGDGLGDIFSHQFPLVTGYKFPNSGLYRLKMQQYMRLDSLPGIVSLGAKVIKTEED